ncbi:MAG: hypothetical protein ACKPHU_09755, partial [Planctomycetaceae bacterium]
MTIRSASGWKSAGSRGASGASWQAANPTLPHVSRQTEKANSACHSKCETVRRPAVMRRAWRN